MKVVDASSWEKRNLGMNAWEITLDRSDMENVSQTIEALQDPKFAGSYVCVKLPVGNLKMVHALEDDGFRFMEVRQALIDCFKPRFDEVVDGGSAGRLVCREVPKNAEAWEQVIMRIVPGMFATDRIALDPTFGPEVSCTRYRNWVRDMLSNPRSRLMVVVDEDTGSVVSFGLEVDSSSTGKFESILGGTFPGHEGVAAAAFSLPSPGIMRTAVSSNNPKVLRVHQSRGRVIYKEQYVLRKIFGVTTTR